MGALPTGGAAQFRTGTGGGIDYHQTVNDNMLVVIMIETPTGVANAYDIASVPGVDVVIIGNNDLAQFSGFPQNDARYQAMVTKIHDDTLRAGKIFGQANAIYATGHPLSKDARFFQNGPSNDGWVPPGRGGGPNPSAPPPGRVVPLGAADGEAAGRPTCGSASATSSAPIPEAPTATTMNCRSFAM